ncbi:MAG: SHOCT domain-containing protein [Candidatus Thermoplasmatota archaeon]|nr:SHOCT domain-containing protein [Candidatus Thermoplasmatota archaeon]
MNSNKNLSSIKTELLVAMIFLILTLIGSIIFFVFFIFLILFVSSNSGFSGPPIFVSPFGLLALVFFIPALIILLRVREMQDAADRGDVEKLKSMNSLGVAIIALLLTGIIPGIMLLIAYSEINQLNTEMSQVDPMERIGALKQMLDEGIIGKEEFESKKASLLKTANPMESKLDDMRKLKEMRDQGLLTEEEFEKMKSKLLSKF